MSRDLVQKIYIVAGQPHFYLAPERNPGWASLRKTYEEIGREIAQSDAELLLLYSTQWFSVIGHLFQTDPAPKWTLVDQNWYEYGEIPYEFRIDPAFGELYCRVAKDYGMQASTVNYHGFPIDTGSVVALRLLDPDNRIPASIVSCNIYAERDETRLLGRCGREAIERYGKKTIVVAVTNLSNRYHVHDVDPAEDAISSQKDDEWNRKILEILDDGRLQDANELVRQFANEANADMGFKALWWLAALTGETNQYHGKVRDYQPVWGTGAGLVELTPTDEPREFEKEYDEITIDDVADKPKERDPAEQPARPVAAPVPASAPASSGSDRVLAAGAPKPVGAYPHARRVGPFLYLSGIGPRDPETDAVPGNEYGPEGELVRYDIEAQTRAVIRNLERVLHESGSTFEKLVDVTVFLTNMKDDFPVFNRIWAEHFGENPPARTTVGVDSLPTPIAIEFKAVAEAAPRPPGDR
jgi:2-aminophenol/2-amino-5-chlorophenol 1,6-dioxygenase subunit alpha